MHALGGAGTADGLAAVELAIRTAMTKLGASSLEQLLAGDTGHRGQRIDCGAGHEAQFISYRPKIQGRQVPAGRFGLLVGQMDGVHHHGDGGVPGSAEDPA
ncbi:MAG: hypothetical protein ACYDAG_14520 [Chloroflexota bacterium]